MKKIIQKIIFLVMMPFLAYAKQHKTDIADYVLKFPDINFSKTFENDMHKTLILSYQIRDVDNNFFESGESLIRPGATVVIDFKKAAQSLKKNSNSKSNNCELVLGLEIALNVPFRHKMSMKRRPLKNSEKGLRITKKDFVSDKQIRFFKGVGGKIVYQAV